MPKPDKSKLTIEEATELFHNIVDSDEKYYEHAEEAIGKVKVYLTLFAVFRF